VLSVGVKAACAARSEYAWISGFRRAVWMSRFELRARSIASSNVIDTIVAPGSRGGWA
jgi:hypothetical protein